MRFRFFRQAEPDPQLEKNRTKLPTWAPKAAWAIAAFMLVLMVTVIVLNILGISIPSLFKRDITSASSETISSLPSLSTPHPFDSINRQANLDTNLPQQARLEPVNYTVEKGDSLFSIAKDFNIKPESLLWANSQKLGEDSGMLSIGVDLSVPPVDGVLYTWQEGDTLSNVAAKFNAKVEDILLWPGNNLDMTNPVIQPDTVIMIPGGKLELKPWFIPVMAGSNQGVNVKINGSGSCLSTGGALGRGSFIWPTQHPGQITGNDYSSFHRGIDAMCYLGEPISASDSGVIIYRGWIEGGYGNMVAIDHGNGYLTLYAHLSGFSSLLCGQNVYQGQTIGYCGSSGNSTGPHLHFEVRLGNGFINPHAVLQ